MRNEVRIESDQIQLWLASDFHLGNVDCDEHEIRRYVGWLTQNDSARVVLLGDLIEAAIPSHLPQTMWSQRIAPQQQLDRVKEMLEPSKEKVLASVRGNHEARIWNLTSLDPSKDIAGWCGCAYLGVGDYFSLRINGIRYTLALFHGYSASANPGYELKKAIAIWGDCDVLAIAHCHQLYREDFKRYRLVKGKRVEQRIVGLRTGGFLRYPEYAKRSFYPPGDVGNPILTLSGREKKIEVRMPGL